MVIRLSYRGMNEIDFQHDLLPLKNKLYRVALRITLDSLEAEDVVEDTLVRVWERRKDVPHTVNLESYCLTICRHLAIDRSEKKDAGHLPLDAAPPEIALDTAHPDEELEQQERVLWVKRVLNTLPEKQRTALQLREIDGRSYEEVAEVMQITAADVKVTLHRARKALKAALEADLHRF